MIRRPPRSTRTDTLCPYNDALPISYLYERHQRHRCSPAEVAEAFAAVLRRRPPELAEGEGDQEVRDCFGRRERLLPARCGRAFPDERSSPHPGHPPPQVGQRRSEARRVGNEWVRPVRSRWAPY